MTAHARRRLRRARGVLGAAALLTPLYLLRLQWRGRARAALPPRASASASAATAAPPQPGALWIHAVSLGETRAAASLIDALRARAARPAPAAHARHGHRPRRRRRRCCATGDAQAWLPCDTPGAVRALPRATSSPRVGVLMETEVWPNLLHAAQRARRADGAGQRAPERAAAGARRSASRALLRPAVESLAAVLAQTEADAAAPARRRRARGRASSAT